MGCGIVETARHDEPMWLDPPCVRTPKGSSLLCRSSLVSHHDVPHRIDTIQAIQLRNAETSSRRSEPKSHVHPLNNDDDNNHQRDAMTAHVCCIGKSNDDLLRRLGLFLCLTGVFPLPRFASLTHPSPARAAETYGTTPCFDAAATRTPPMSHCQNVASCCNTPCPTSLANSLATRVAPAGLCSCRPPPPPMHERFVSVLAPNSTAPRLFRCNSSRPHQGTRTLFELLVMHYLRTQTYIQ